MAVAWESEAAIAVVKPDHLGDFVLAVPALRALADTVPGFDLFAAPSNRFLFEHFLPSGCRFRPAAFRHLTRNMMGLDEGEALEQLGSYSTVVMLRNDGVLAAIQERLGSSCRMLASRNDVHETALHRDAIRDLTGDYSRTERMWAGDPPSWPDRIATVGISLSAGFTSNKLPLATWLRVAELLDRQGVAIRLIGGPQESAELDIAWRQLPPSSEPIVGSSDLGAFFDQLSACDVVIGADSGSLHLVSTTRPVVGVFTSSPWRRFAPFGPHVRVLHSPLPCAPCLQYSPNAFNACVTRECAGRIRPDDIVAAVFAPGAPPGVRSDGTLRLVTAPATVASSPERA